jgi:hypothetical protein
LAPYTTTKADQCNLDKVNCLTMDSGEDGKTDTVDVCKGDYNIAGCRVLSKPNLVDFRNGVKTIWKLAPTRQFAQVTLFPLLTSAGNNEDQQCMAS